MRLVIPWANRFALPLCRPAPPPCPAPPRLWVVVRIFDSIRQIFIIPGYVRTSKFTETERRRPTGQQPGTKSGRGRGDKSPVNRPSRSHRFTSDFLCSCLGRGIQNAGLRCAGGRIRLVIPWAHRFALPCLCVAPPRLVRELLCGFWVRCIIPGYVCISKFTKTERRRPTGQQPGA